MDSLDFRLINDFQRDFPLEPQPFAEIAWRLCADEETVLAALQRLREEGVVSRVGAVVRAAPRRRQHAGRPGGAAGAPGGDRGARQRAARGQPQLRARTPLQPVVRRHRLRRAAPGAHAGGHRARHRLRGDFACRWSTSSTSTSVSISPASASRRAPGRRIESRRPARTDFAGAEAADGRAAARPRPGAAALRPARRAGRPGRAGSHRHAQALARRGPDQALRRRRAPPRAGLHRQRHGGLGPAGRRGGARRRRCSPPNRR